MHLPAQRSARHLQARCIALQVLAAGALALATVPFTVAQSSTELQGNDILNFARAHPPTFVSSCLRIRTAVCPCVLSKYLNLQAAAG